MNRTDANEVARILGGKAHNTGGGQWIVRIDRPDGRVIVITDDIVALYPDADAWDQMDDLPADHITLH